MLIKGYFTDHTLCVQVYVGSTIKRNSGRVLTMLYTQQVKTTMFIYINIIVISVVNVHCYSPLNSYFFLWILNFR